MKKVFLSTCMIAAMLFQGCDNENSVNPAPSLGTATITGTVYANLDLTNNEYETAPANIRILAKINTEDLVLQKSNVTYADKFYETTTDSDGKFTLEIEAGSKNVHVTIYPQDLELMVKNYADNADINDENPATIQEKRIFGGNQFSVIVYKGGNFIRNITLHED